MWPKVSISLIKTYFAYTGKHSCKLELLKDISRKIFVLSIFEWQFYTSFTEAVLLQNEKKCTIWVIQ